MSGRYSPHPNYKDSGLDWLGLIPKSWELRRLGSYFRERRTKASDKDFSALSVTMQGIVPQLETAAKTKDGDNRKLVRAGDFVINSRSDRKGSSGVSPYDGSVSLISIVLEPVSIHPPFVHHLLRSSAFQEEFYRFGKGIVADLWSTNYAAMKNIVIPVMSEQEQTQIAKFLDYETTKIDSLIEKQQQLIALLKEKRQAVISHAVTKGLNPDAPMRDSGVEWLGEVPNHWTSIRLRHACSHIFLGLTSKVDYVEDGGVPLARLSNIKGGKLDLSDARCISTKQHRSLTKRNRARRNDVLLGKSGAVIGTTAIVDTDVEFSIYESLFALRSQTITPRYLTHLLRSQSCHNQFGWSASVGMGIGHLNMADILDVYVAIPPVSEQGSIVEALDAKVERVEELTDKAERAIGLMSERRTALIAAAVTGKIDVRDWKAPESPTEVA